MYIASILILSQNSTKYHGIDSYSTIDQWCARTTEFRFERKCRQRHVTTAAQTQVVVGSYDTKY